MPNPRPNHRTVALIAGLIACAGVASCGEEAPPPAPVVSAPSAPAPPPDPMENLPLHPKVQFPAERAPSTRELAVAIATLASALAKGDASAAQSVLDRDAANLIDQMVNSGEWKQGTTGIEAVRVCVLNETKDTQIATVALGIQDAQGAYLLAWRGSAAAGAWEFEPMPLNDTEAAQVALLDGSPIISRTLPSPESVNVDPESRKVKVRKRFSKDGNSN